MISVKNLETLLQLAVSCREYPACAVRPEDLEDVARELLEYRAKRTEELSQLEEQVRQLREALTFYANREIYPLAILECIHFDACRDAGEIARAALASTKPKEKDGGPKEQA
jgi:hypothetical protein